MTVSCDTLHSSFKIHDYFINTFVELHGGEKTRVWKYGSHEHQTLGLDTTRGFPSIPILRYQLIGVRLNVVRIRAGQNSSTPSIFSAAYPPLQPHTLTSLLDLQHAELALERGLLGCVLLVLVPL